ncbi:MAG: anti-sigma factor [Phycisphaerae bacterium]|nr:anti-sigma factor [Phycisphaerae bacterium]
MSELPPMSPRDERLYDLAVARATIGLSASEDREYAELSSGVSPAELAAIAEAVAALARAFEADDVPMDEEPMPEAVRLALLASAPNVRKGPVNQASTEPPPEQREAMIASLRRTARAGWLVAAASLLVAAAILLSRSWGTRPPPSTEQLVDAAPDVVRLAFTPTPDGFAGSTGEVVWSESLQRGYMRLTGVPNNDVSKTQYQLWIVDKNRDAEPVDGGVFNVAAGGAGAIVFEPRLPVSRPDAFAITAERPGGVVVSEGPILMVAAAKK